MNFQSTLRLTDAERPVHSYFKTARGHLLRNIRTFSGFLFMFSVFISSGKEYIHIELKKSESTARAGSANRFVQCNFTSSKTLHILKESFNRKRTC